jgi:hypothetical protein
LTVPEAGEAGGGCLVLDDGISTDGRCFILDVRVALDAGRLRIGVGCTDRGLRPMQQELELRLPLEFRALAGNATRYELRERSLADEDRAVVLRAVSIPLHAGDYVVK